MTLRSHPRKVAGLALAIAFLATPCVALTTQDSKQVHALFGRVVAKSGEPVAGARVHVCSRVLPSRLDIGTPIELETTTDARGGFRIEAPSGRAYTLWAAWEDDDGAVHVTELVTDRVVDRPARLVEDGVRRQHGIELEGADAWRDSGLCIRAGTEIGDRFVMDIDAESPRLPILPGNTIAVEVRTRTGMLIAYEGLDSQELDVQVGTIPITIAKPLRITIRLVSAVSGLPLENAWVEIATQCAMGGMSAHLPPSRVATTDRDGLASFVIPERLHVVGRRLEDNHQFLLFGAEDHAVTKAAIRRIDTVQEFRIEGGKSLVGRLEDFDGNALANTALVLMTMTRFDGQETCRLGMLPRVLETDAKGGFRFDGLTGRDSWELYLPGAALRGQRGFPTHLHAIACGTASAATNVGTVRLNQLADVTLGFEHADATPAIAISVLLRGPSSYQYATHITNHAGQLRCLLPKGEWFAGAWSVGGGVARERIVLEDKTTMTIRLSKTISISGRVLDDRGRPIGGASVQFCGRPHGVEEGLADVAFRQCNPAMSDATGHFELQVPVSMARYELQASVQRGERWFWSTPTKVDVENNDVDRVLLTISGSQ
ncbi:MAG: carboxypeptidase regulatory-like domain-containing protein [Planctomycetes bacterium]|nr:carboxypeptidase regulatory-like domain-containing protein [Planctomycetota bacterium]